MVNFENPWEKGKGSVFKFKGGVFGLRLEKRAFRIDFLWFSDI